MEERSRRRSARDRDPLAPRGIPSLLAFALRARAGTTTDFRGHEEAHRSHGDGESLASSEDPSRAVEAWDRAESHDDLALSAESSTRSGFPPAMGHLPAESPGHDRRNGLLRRADGPLPAALRLVRD